MSVVLKGQCLAEMEKRKKNQSDVKRLVAFLTLVQTALFVCLFVCFS